MDFHFVLFVEMISYVAFGSILKDLVRGRIGYFVYFGVLFLQFFFFNCTTIVVVFSIKPKCLFDASFWKKILISIRLLPG